MKWMIQISTFSSAVVLLLVHVVSAQTPLTTVRIYPPNASPTALNRPIFVACPPGDNTRLFIVEQRIGNSVPTNAQGRIQILNMADNTLLPTPFLTTTGQNTSNEEGLLGLAFHPDFFADAPNPNRGAFFIYITQGGNNHVRRYTTTGQDPTANTADAASMQLVLTINHPTNANHNGGWIGFGPDGYLYVATGDGGSGCDPSGNAQNINSLLGKMLRLDVAADQDPGNTTVWGYVNPPSNPFVGVAGLDEIYHYGLRNPWRCSFDRANGNLYIGDVGQNAREEVSLAPAGVAGINFGWRTREGFVCSNAPSSFCSSTCSTTGLINPVWDYPWTSGSAVTGGYVYRGSLIPDLKGHYFFANYIQATVSGLWSFRYTGSCNMSTGQCTAVTAGQVVNRASELVPTGPIGGLNLAGLVSFGEDAVGELYIVKHVPGEIYKIVVNCSGSSISINTHPQSQTVCEGQNVSFTVAATGMRGLFTYTWRKDGDIVGTDSALLSLTNVTSDDAGDYTCTITDQCNQQTSLTATLTVDPLPLGDVNGDCSTNLLDIPPFVNVLIGTETNPGFMARANVDGQGDADGMDIQVFVDLLLNP